MKQYLLKKQDNYLVLKKENIYLKDKVKQLEKFKNYTSYKAHLKQLDLEQNQAMNTSIRESPYHHTNTNGQTLLSQSSLL